MMAAPGTSPRASSQLVGRYRLLAPIASGGTATVYLGRSEAIGGFSRVVAVKLLHPHLLQEPSSQAAQEFLEEAKLSARMQHPLIVPVLDVGTSEQGLYLVMEYVDGASLADLLQRKRNLPRPIIGRILVDVLEALQAAHTAVDERELPLGIVHRDFSPQNILVGSDGRSRLTDFGIAKATSRAEYTHTGLIKGKIAYMSPEQAEGTELDQRSDVWAAGVVAWEMLAGKRMYPKLDPLPHLLRIINREAPELRAANPELPAELVDAVHAALVRAPEARTASAAQLSSQLCQAFGGTSQLATHAEVGEYLETFELDRLATLRTIIQQATSEDLPAALSQTRLRRPDSTTMRAQVPSSPNSSLVTIREPSSLRFRAHEKRIHQWGVAAAALLLPALFFMMKWPGPEHRRTTSTEELLAQPEIASVPTAPPLPAPEHMQTAHLEEEPVANTAPTAPAATNKAQPPPTVTAAAPKTQARISAARTSSTRSAQSPSATRSFLAPSPY